MSAFDPVRKSWIVIDQPAEGALHDGEGGRCLHDLTKRHNRFLLSKLGIELLANTPDEITKTVMASLEQVNAITEPAVAIA
jgi:hypothetical protein